MFVSNPSMAAGKVKSAMGIQKDPAVPLAEVPKNVLLPNNRQSPAANTLQRSKVRATEYSSRVKRSLIAYFPRAAQVQPRPSECNSTKRDAAEGGQHVKEPKERETKLHSELAKNTVTVNKISELEKELRMKSTEVEDLNRRIDLLEAEKNQLCEDIAAVPTLKMEIEAAKAQIEDLQKERCVSADRKLQKDLEIENMELRRLNVELQDQRREISTKLATAESQIVALSNTVQTDRVRRAETEDSVLRHANEDLRKQVEGLQMNRFSEVEELAHLRWVNASLRYQLSNCKLSSGKMLADDSNDRLSPKSHYIAKQLTMEYAVPELPLQQGKRQADCDNEGLSSYSSNISEAEEFDDVSLENFQGLISISKRSSPNGTFNNLTQNTDNWRFSDFDSAGQQSHSNKTSQRHQHSCNYSSEEFLEHSLQHGKRVSADVTELRQKHLGNGDTAKISPSARTESRRVKSDRFEQSSKSVLSKANAIDLPNDISASFRLLSKTPDGELEKHSALKDRQRIFLQKVEQANVEKQVTVPKCSEVAKLTPIAVEKRALRTPKPPPKPSSAAAVADGPANCFRSVPPPPPPPPPRPGVKGAQPPPPPPPPSKFLAREASAMQRVPEVVEFYHSLMKRDAKKDSSGSGPPDTPDVANARSSMIGEIENRSSHWLAIKTDVETQGDFVRSLIREVRAAVYTNIEDVAAFVKWLDDELSFLVDERAVLKHFDWPERKADAMREAAFGYCDLKKLEYEVSSYEDDLHLSCTTSLKKMLALLEKLEHSVYSLLRNRDMAMARYKEFQIPSEWMLDTGIVSKIKFASVKLAKKYMKRVAIELESMGNSEKEITKEFLMLQGVRFAFRVHQFAGGFDIESMCAFEELRNLAHMYHKESQEQQQYRGVPTC